MEQGIYFPAMKDNKPEAIQTIQSIHIFIADHVILISYILHIT